MRVARQPSPALAPFVKELWYCDGHAGGDGTQRLLPKGRFELAISLVEGPISALSDPMGDGGGAAPALLIGIRSRFSFMDTARLGSAMGVVFRPGGVRVFLNTPADVFSNKRVSLDLVWGSMTRNLRDRLRTTNHTVEKFRVLETALLEHFNERVESNAAVRFALQEFARKPRCESICPSK